MEANQLTVAIMSVIRRSFFRAVLGLLLKSDTMQMITRAAVASKAVAILVV